MNAQWQVLRWIGEGLPGLFPSLTGLDVEFETRLSRARFRAWHRGTREADYMIGGFFDRYHQTWAEADLAWFEALLEEDDVDVLAWKTGEWLPLHIGAGPLALLGALPDREIERYLMLGPVRSTRHGVLTEQDMRAEVALVRRRGWSVNREAITEGVASLGVVVRDRTGQPICALSVAGLERRYHGQELDRTAAAVLEAARELGRQITGR